ncbi:MAG: alpha/beta fold hydrolase [Proteobacteria bacterium]|nr:alpha/beta fold hydrolase [Pseudomonadota bacterium]
MNARLVWDRDGADWPNREASQFIKAAGLKWHVQTTGCGPVALLLHGTGASSHSWRRLTSFLNHHFTVVAPDLPGHGFTSMPQANGLSLSGIAHEVSELMHVLGLEPDLVIGHSAGAAIAMRATIDRLLTPSTIVSINGALLPFGTPIGQFFSPLAKLLVSTPIVAQIMAWRGQNRVTVQRVIFGTGSRIEPQDLDYYSRLFGNPGHVAGALGMMANWDLSTFAADLTKLTTHTVLIAAENDRAISPADAVKVAQLLQQARLIRLSGAGHLAHEEQPGPIAKIIIEAASDIFASSSEVRSKI